MSKRDATAGAYPRQIALVINPAADRGAAIRVGAGAAATLSAVFDVRLHQPLRGAVESIATIRRAIADGADAVVVCGGDGMVHLAANVLAGGHIPLGVLPAGSGNDIADVLGMDRHPAAAARQIQAALTAGSVARIDVGRCDGPPLVPGTSRAFVGLLYAGIDSAVNERANRMRRMPGAARYNVALAIETARLRARCFQLVVDGEPRDIPAILVAIGNGPQYGGGKRIAPHASWDDGVLGVTVIGPISRFTLARIAPSLRRAGHVGHPRVLLLNAKSVTMDCAEPGTVAYADGEYVGPLPIRVWVERGGLPVLVPPNAGTIGT
ncbi:MAG: diacylglycerol kinase family protein [Nakamurella sp.]